MIRRWRNWRRTQRMRRQLSADYCRVCDVQLRFKDIWEERFDEQADPETGGGTFLAITYCRRHAPKGAVQI